MGIFMDRLKLLALACCFSLIRVGAGWFWDGHDDARFMDYYVGNWTTGTNFTLWTQGKTFYFGDKLTFTVTGADSVVPVPKDQYDTCKWTFPKNIVPAPDKARNVTVLPLLGDNYYISAVEENCKAGLKLKVTVLSRPLAPAPPAYTPQNYTVGDDRGWALGVNYEQWTENKKFYFGDVFKFVFNSSQHSVVEVFENAFDYCNETYFPPVGLAPREVQSDGRAVLHVIPPIGSHYFVSSISNDCQQGLKVKLEIEPTDEAFDDSHAPAPSPSAAVAGQDSSDGYLISPQLGTFAILFSLSFFI